MATSAEEASHGWQEKAGSTTLPQSAICDLGDLESVRACALGRAGRAGTVSDTLRSQCRLQYAGAKEPRRTPQGFRAQRRLKHLGICLLAQLLTTHAGGRTLPRLGGHRFGSGMTHQRRRQGGPGQPGW